MLVICRALLPVRPKNAPNIEQDRYKSWYTKNRARVIARVAAWKRANPEKVRASTARNAATNRARVKEWKTEHRAQHNAWVRGYKKRDPEKYKALHREYYQRTKKDVRWRLQCAKRYARIHGAKGAASSEAVKARIAFYGWKCAYCPGPYEELDHAIPISRGGPHCPANIRPACKPCNRSKGSRTPKEWAAYRIELAKERPGSSIEATLLRRDAFSNASSPRRDHAAHRGVRDERRSHRRGLPRG